MTQNGATALIYDLNGNMLSDGTNTHTWDRANRLRTVGSTSYSYDGDGNRVSQTVSGTVTRYLLDTQPGLALVLGETTGGVTTHYLHSPRGIHSAYTAGNRTDYLQDGLGSVRLTVDNTGGVVNSVNYTPYGIPDNSITGFAFTGEQRDGNGFQYHRARYLNPQTASWLSLDPFEGIHDRPMSLNGYSWVEGNVVNFTDSKGNCVPCVVAIAAGILLAGCTPTAQLTPYDALAQFPEGVLDKTVAITTGNTPNVPEDFSLGTIIRYNGFTGIVTHDHYAGCQAYDATSCVFDGLKEKSKWITFDGSKKAHTILTNSEQFSAMKEREILWDKPGVTFFELPETLLSAIGNVETNIASYETFNSFLSRQLLTLDSASPILYPYWSITQSPTHAGIKSGAGYLLTESPENLGTRDNPRRFLLSGVQALPGYSVESGSSGGGNFAVVNGQLTFIGVTQSAISESLTGQGYSIHYFAKIL